MLAFIRNQITLKKNTMKVDYLIHQIANDRKVIYYKNKKTGCFFYQL